MRVLLVSPIDPEKPLEHRNLMGGENTYTKMLLSNPPRGVDFTYFEEALKTRDVSYHWTQYFLLLLQKLRFLPPGPRVQSLILHKKYDLVYVHAYPIKLTGKQIPIVLSDSSSGIVFLEKYLKWSKWQLSVSRFIKSLTFRVFAVQDGEVLKNNLTPLFVFSRWAKKIKKKEFGNKKCMVIYPGLPSSKTLNLVSRRDNSNNTLKILFVGVWFERKGGKIVLAAFNSLSKKYKNIELTILGSLPKDISISDQRHIKQYDFVSYKRLQSFYKTHHVLVHVPAEVEGYGMAVPEAMSYGMIPVVSRVCVLPEFVDDFKSGLIVTPGSVKSLEKALTKLIKSKDLRLKLRRGARKKFEEKFSLEVFHKRLSSLFRNLL